MGRHCPDRPTLMLQLRTQPASNSCSSAASTAITHLFSAQPPRPSTDGCAAGTPRRFPTARTCWCRMPPTRLEARTVRASALSISNPTASILIPKSGATLSGSITLDASASNATGVDFRFLAAPTAITPLFSAQRPRPSTDGCAVGTVRVCPTVGLSWCPRPPPQPRVHTARGRHHSAQLIVCSFLFTPSTATGMVELSDCDRKALRGCFASGVRSGLPLAGKRTDCTFCTHMR